ncbi:hypothetical protein CERSUDRAFT_53277 [Gelatoporia subvermispora B]|uniref:Cytochrome P450 n=1 Tax=Ceriporiopsis subvermispora (strain B) TaxID=914234 RepID=M2RA75_CERS8|nr:hypothetical protein CERSUDRAFT_53277 [Gelatoporia subvermispora B]
MSFISSTLLLILIVGLAYIIARHSSSRRVLYPPGPQGWPIIGNLLNIPRFKPWERYLEWSKQYGPIIYMNVLGKHIVVLNTAKAVSDLFEIRSAIYSDRTRFIMVSLLDLEWNMILMRYGNSWRQHRRMIHTYFNDEIIKDYQPIQQKKARQLVSLLVQRPDRFLEHTRFVLGASILEVIYGTSIDDPNHPFLEYAESAAQAGIEAFLPGSLLVEFFHFLRYMPSWFPGADFKNRLPKWYADTRGLHNFTFEEAKSNYEMSKNVSAVVYVGKTQYINITSISSLHGSYIEAGADTTFFTLKTFYAAMVLHPDVQKRAQEELARVVGPERLPEFADREHLPYVCALVKECLRWITIVPLGVAHATSEDNVYDGYFIPKGTIVMANQWAILHNPDEYPDPGTFEPERFLKDNAINEAVRDPITVTTGFGRRICPGRHFAESSIFIIIASILHSFDISAPLDKYGVPMYPDLKLSTGLVVHVEDVKCTFKARSQYISEQVVFIHDGDTM